MTPGPASRSCWLTVAEVLTIDASVRVAADPAAGEGHGVAQSFMYAVVASGSVIHQPTLALVEVTAALARRTHDQAFAQRAGLAMLATPGVQLHPLDREMARAASAIASRAILRGADAVYAATAMATGSVLVTLGGELLTRGIPGIDVMTPGDWLAARHTSESSS